MSFSENSKPEKRVLNDANPSDEEKQDHDNSVHFKALNIIQHINKEINDK